MYLTETRHYSAKKGQQKSSGFCLPAAGREYSEIKKRRCNNFARVRSFKPQNRSSMYLLTWGIYEFDQ